MESTWLFNFEKFPNVLTENHIVAQQYSAQHVVLQAIVNNPQDMAVLE